MKLISRVKKSLKSKKTYLLTGFFMLALVGVINPPYGFYRIATGSMLPTIEINDVVIVRKWFNPEDLEVGDIFAFKANLFNNQEKEIVVHYVHSIVLDEFGTTYRSIAENKTAPDAWIIQPSDIVGLYVNKIDGIGRIFQFINSTLGRVILVADVFLIYIIVTVDDDKKKSNEKKHD